ncbi:MAG: AzlD domain-containing protein [Mogibacterium sp.]|nr:AzlD domain-containing protein [Mogibacterium sp.]MBQ6440794.1 AzlD domain-containing protein [Mogibacterium sp.]
MTDHRHAMIVIAVMGLAVLATRIVPVLIFGRGEKVPEFILYLGRVVPYTAMGLLIVYCLRDMPLLEAPHGLPEIISLAVVTGTYLWKRNTILSVVAGTALYMLLLQSIF